MNPVDDIKARVDIVDLVGETVRLRRSGKNYTGFCPFHQNIRTPSFAVFPESGTWRCFGACNEGGDIFRFVMKKQACDFPEALRILAQRAGVELRQRTEADVRAEETHTRLRNLLEAASAFFRQQLLDTEEGGRVRDYLYGRKLNDASLEAFQIGLAPVGWEQSLHYLREKGYADEEIVSAGVALPGQGGGLRDRFRHRITIPIRDGNGRMCGFGARIVNPTDQPKFINSPQSPLFDKGGLLFGLDRAARAIRSAQEAVLVEGYLDVIAAHQAGFENVVSPMGTALTESQFRLIKRHSKRLILALDPDSAGESATMRGLELAREAMDHEREPVFDARGLLRYESRLQADLRVAELPDGKDPDEVVLEDPEDWRRRVAQAQPVVLHVLHTLLRGREVDDPKTKAEIAARMMPLIEDVGNPVEREAYRQQVARALRVDERAMVSTGPARRKRTPARGSAPEKAPTPAAGGMPQAEAYTLGLLLRKPETLSRIDRAFGEMGMERIGPEDFTNPASAGMIGVIRDSALQERSEPEEYVRENTPAESAGALQYARDAYEKFHSESEPSIDEAINELLKLRRKMLERRRADIRYYLQEFQTADDEVEEGRLEAKQEAQKRMDGVGGEIKKIDRVLADRANSAG